MLRITTQNGYVEWDKIDIDSIDLPPSEDNYGIPSDDEDLTPVSYTHLTLPTKA